MPKLTQAQAVNSVVKAAKTIAVVQWYDKDTTDCFFDRKLTNEEFKLVVDEIRNYMDFDSEQYIYAVKDILANNGIDIE